MKEGGSTHIKYKPVRLDHSGRDPLIWLLSKSLRAVGELSALIFFKLIVSSPLELKRIVTTHKDCRLARWDHSGRDPMIWLLFKYLRAIDEQSPLLVASK